MYDATTHGFRFCVDFAASQNHHTLFSLNGWPESGDQVIKLNYWHILYGISSAVLLNTEFISNRSERRLVGLWARLYETLTPLVSWKLPRDVSFSNKLTNFS